MSGSAHNSVVQDSLLRRMDASGVPLLIARLILGGLFIYMGYNKLGDPVAFLKLINQYEMELPPVVLNSTAIVLPWMEIITGAALILGVLIRGAAATMAGMLLFFTPVVLMRALNIVEQTGQSFFDVKFDCGCGAGEVVIWTKLLENTGLFILALVALFSGSRRFCGEFLLVRRNPNSPFCHLCGYATRHSKAGLCHRCATPPNLPMGEPAT